MSSGDKRIIINTRERAISNDINRLQAFKASQLAELARQAISRATSTPLLDGLGGAGFDYVAGTSPQPPYGADVLNGLFAVADNGTGVTITRGAAGFWVHDWSTSTDDSNYIVAQSDGVPSVATFPFVANGGGSPRWDLVIAYVDDETVTEQANRDIRNSTTGLFSPSLVDKVKLATLKFAYITGTAGNPIPSPPAVGSYGSKQCRPVVLAAICVYPFAAGFTSCDFYDTRPLVNARVAPGDYQKNAASTGREVVWNDRLLKPSFHYSGGFFSQVEGYAVGMFGDGLVGGRLRKNVPSAALAQFGVVSSKSSYVLAAIGGDSIFIDPDDPDIADAADPPGGAHTLTALAFGWPTGYERFIRYTQAIGHFAAPYTSTQHPGVRVPAGPNGVIAAVGSGSFSNTGIAAVVGGGPPAFNGCDMTYIAAAWLYRDSSNDRLWAPMVNGKLARWPRTVHSISGGVSRSVTAANSQSATVVTSLPDSSAVMYWTLNVGSGTIPNGYAPKGARFLRVRVRFQVSLAGAGYIDLTTLSVRSGIPNAAGDSESIYWDSDGAAVANYRSPNTSTAYLSVDARIPVHVLAGFGEGTFSPSYLAAIIYGYSDASTPVNITAVTTAALYIIGYEN